MADEADPIIGMQSGLFGIKAGPDGKPDPKDIEDAMKLSLNVSKALLKAMWASNQLRVHSRYDGSSKNFLLFMQCLMLQLTMYSLNPVIEWYMSTGNEDDFDIEPIDDFILGMIILSAVSHDQVTILSRLSYTKGTDMLNYYSDRHNKRTPANLYSQLQSLTTMSCAETKDPESTLNDVDNICQSLKNLGCEFPEMFYVSFYILSLNGDRYNTAINAILNDENITRDAARHSITSAFDQGALVASRNRNSDGHRKFSGARARRTENRPEITFPVDCPRCGKKNQYHRPEQCWKCTACGKFGHKAGDSYCVKTVSDQPKAKRTAKKSPSTKGKEKDKGVSLYISDEDE